MSPRAPLGCDSFSELVCSWWLWQFWGVLISYAVECPSNGIWLMFLEHVLIMFLSWLGWGFGSGGGECKRQSTIFITLEQGYAINVIYDSWYWPWSLGWWSVCQVFPQWTRLLTTLPHCPLWGQVTVHSPYLGSRWLCSTSFRVKYTLFGRVLHDSCLFSQFINFLNHLFNTVWNPGYLLYTLNYNLMPLYSIAHSVLTLATGGSFGWLLYPFDISPSFFF